MKKQLSFGKFRSVRVWIRELPECTFETSQRTEIIVPAADRSLPAAKAAIEFFVPIGPRAMYGLLGGEFRPANTGQLKVIISSEKASKTPFESSLLNSNHVAFVGLHTEYADAVGEGVRLAQEEITLPAGEFIINCSAHSETGSSSALFKQLAMVLVKLVSSPAESLTDAEIISLFPQTI
jgi:hypothetical protein